MASRRWLEVVDKERQKTKQGHGHIGIIPMRLWRHNTPEGGTIIRLYKSRILEGCKTDLMALQGITLSRIGEEGFRWINQQWIVNVFLKKC